MCPVHEVQERKEKDPDDVDEVPVEARHLNWRVPLRRESSLPGHPRDDAHDAEADHHVQGMKPRHCEVEGDEDLHLVGVHPLEVEVRPRNVAQVVLVLVLEELDDQEGQPERHRQQQVRDRRLAEASTNN